MDELKKHADPPIQQAIYIKPAVRVDPSYTSSVIDESMLVDEDLQVNASIIEEDGQTPEQLPKRSTQVEEFLKLSDVEMTIALARMCQDKTAREVSKLVASIRRDSSILEWLLPMHEASSSTQSQPGTSMEDQRKINHTKDMMERAIRALGTDLQTVKDVFKDKPDMRDEGMEPVEQKTRLAFPLGAQMVKTFQVAQWTASHQKGPVIEEFLGKDKFLTPPKFNHYLLDASTSEYCILEKAKLLAQEVSNCVLMRRDAQIKGFDPRLRNEFDEFRCRGLTQHAKLFPGDWKNEIEYLEKRSLNNQFNEPFFNKRKGTLYIQSLSAFHKDTQLRSRQPELEGDNRICQWIREP